MSSRTLPISGMLFFAGMILATLACIAGLPVAFLSAAVWPIVFLGIMHFFEVDLGKLWLKAALPAFAIASGTAVDFFAGLGTFHPLMWLCAPLTAAITAAILLIATARRKRCSLCNTNLGGDVSFACPRCGLVVCERKCWNFEHSRCALCEQNHVPVLPMEGRWWDQRLGPRSGHGQCQLCKTAAGEADLRACGKCGRPHCRDCWDFSNGQCTRCGWVIPDLPESLKPFMPDQSQQESQTGARMRRG